MKKQVQPTTKNNGTTFARNALGIIFIATLAIYFKALNFDFIFNWDDQAYIPDNTDIRGLGWDNIKLFFTRFYNNNYQPITILFYAIEYKVGEGKEFIFHLNNIALHIINTYLVFEFIKKLSPKNSYVALITAALFAIHPMHIESVAWISERKDVLYSCFFLLSLNQYLDYVSTDKIKHLLLAFLLFVLSCLSKSAAVILPLVLLLLDFYENRKYTIKTLLEKVPFFVIALVFGIVATKSQRGAINDMAPIMTFMEHFSLVCHSFMNYILKAFVPTNLSAIYPYPMELGSKLPSIYYVSIVGVGLVLAFVIYSYKWGKDVIFGFLFFVITIILVLQFVPVGAATMADRYTYIPYIGLFFIIGKFYEYLLARTENYQKHLSVIFMLGFLIFASISFGRINVWKNDETLFTDVIKKYPYSGIAYINRGTYYYSTCATQLYAGNEILKQRYTSKALSDFDKGLKLKLSSLNKARTYFCVGIVKSDLKDFDGSVEAFSNSIAADTLFAPTSYIRMGNSHKAHADKINNATKKAEYLKKAISAYHGALKYALALDTKADIHYQIGVAKSDMGDYSDAINTLNYAIRLDPKKLKPYIDRGNAKLMLDDYQGALKDCDTVVALDPTYALGYLNRGAIKYYIKDYKGAINDADKAIKNYSKNATAYTLRGNAEYAQNNFEAALIDYNKAIELNPQEEVALKNREIVRENLKRLAK